MLQFTGRFGPQTQPSFTTNLKLNGELAFSLNSLSTQPLTVKTPKLTIYLFSEFYQYKGKTSPEALQDLVNDINKYGKDTLTKLHGQYALLIIDNKNLSVSIATDKMGSVPIYYHSDKQGCFYFSTHLSDLLQLLDTKPSINPQGIHNYIYHHCIPAPHTIYTHVFKMQCGELLNASKQSFTTSSYFVPSFSNEAVDAKAMQEKLLDSLEASVSDRVGQFDSDKVGAFLSGGLDSSTVSGMFAKTVGPNKAKTFTMGFHAKGYDESAFAKSTSDHFKTNHAVYYVTPEDVEHSLPDIAAYYDEPFGNSSALPAYHCAKFAKEHGVQVMLAGDGGDELFGGNDRYAKQKIFELYYKIPGPLRKALLEAPLSKVDKDSTLPLISKIASYVRQASVKLPDRLQTYNFLHQIDPNSVFTSNLLSATDQLGPLNSLRERYNQPDSADTLSRMLFLDWKFTLADNDLVKVSNMCHKAGVDVLYPMLDDRLIELATVIPSNLKLPGNKLRDFYKETTKPFLPESTINKSKQGFGLPFGVWMRTHKPLQEMAYDNVLALKSTGYFNDAFLEKAIDMHRQGHASYYGELVWILSMLNMWLAAH